MDQVYADDFKRKLKAQPLRHRLRMTQLELRAYWHQQQCRGTQGAHSLPDHGGMIRVHPRLQPPPYRYGKLRGPWIESAFFQHWNRQSCSFPCRYLPIFFDPIFFHSQVHKYPPQVFESLQALLRETLDRLDTAQPCFTVLGMYDFPIWDWHLFPRQVIVYSSAGGGDIPIPLLSGDRPFRSTHKDILVSFMGSLDGASNAGGLRQRMAQALKDFAYFGQGSQWEQVMGRSVFSLCPRGQAPASFRLFEAMSLGSIPIYVWDQVEWLPYRDELDWSEFAVSIHIDDISQLPAILKAKSASAIAGMQQRLADVYYEYFTIEAVCNYIHRHSQRLRSVRRVHEITQNRVYG